jgi:hypothetical protein
MKAFLCTIALTTTMSFAAHASPDRSARDGNWWRQQKPAIKTFYVIGLLDGMNTGSRIIERSMTELINRSYTEAINDLFMERSAGQLASGLDEFYKDYRNLSIEASDAIIVCALSSSGADQATIDTALSFLRKTYSKMPAG